MAKFFRRKDDGYLYPYNPLLEDLIDRDPNLELIEIKEDKVNEDHVKEIKDEIRGPVRTTKTKTGRH